MKSLTAVRFLSPAILVTILWFGLSPMPQAGVHYTQLKSFMKAGDLGTRPEVPPIVGSDGALYGTTVSGGAYANPAQGRGGTVFRVNKDGTDYRVLHNFGNGSDPDPPARLFEASDGYLYGATSRSIFKVRRDGGGYLRLHDASVGQDGLMGAYPLLEGSDGVLYGVTAPIAPVPGAVFRMNKDGSGYTVLHRFTGDQETTERPVGLVEAKPGVLYGALSSYNVSFGLGMVFRINTDGQGYETLLSFSGPPTDGTAQVSDGEFVFLESLEKGTDGNIYGTGLEGDNLVMGVFQLAPNGKQYLTLPEVPVGETTGGVLFGVLRSTGLFPYLPNSRPQIPLAFRVNPDGGSYSVLHRFDGFSPTGLTKGPDGYLYGTSRSGGSNDLGVVFALLPDGGSYQVVHLFAAGEGNTPKLPPVLSKDGLIYGTTDFGGLRDEGTVFRVKPDGSDYAEVFGNVGAPSTGSRWSSFFGGSDGLFYGTKGVGGNAGSGAVVKLSRDGSVHEVLHSFDAAEGGFLPVSLVDGGNGKLYGTTLAGTNNMGVIFSLDKDDGEYAVIHQFTGPDGLAGESLLAGRDGALYGSAGHGGAFIDVQHGFYGNGAIFRVKRDGSEFTLLRSFGSTPNDALVPGPLTEGSDGVLYGCSWYGGANGLGAIFKLNKDGRAYAVLHSFSDLDRGDPNSTLVEGTDGRLYGTTHFGGANRLGGIFRISKEGSGYTVLYDFDSRPGDGVDPVGLALGKDGAFYGTTTSGGVDSVGTLFRFSPPETPDIEAAFGQKGIPTIRISGRAGESYKVEWSTDLRTWSSVGTFALPASGLLTLPDARASATGAFYRACWMP